MPQFIKKSDTLYEFRFNNAKKDPRSTSIYFSTNDGFTVGEIKEAYNELSLAYKKKEFDPWMDEVVTKSEDMPTVGMVADKYFELCKRKYAEGTVRVYEGNLKLLTDYLGRGTLIDEVTKGSVEMHINSFRKKATRNNHRAIAQNLFNYAYQNRYVDRLIKFEAVGGESVTPKDFLSIGELKKMSDHIIKTHPRGQYISDMMHVAFFTGFRLSEVDNFKPKWVSGDFRFLTYGDKDFQPKRRDRNELDTLPLLDEIKPLMRRILKDVDPNDRVFEEYKKGYISDLLVEVSDDCFADKRISMHSLRKSFAMYLINEKDLSPKELHEMMRHGEMGTTMKYYTDKEIDRLEDAVNGKYGKSMVNENRGENDNPRKSLGNSRLRLVSL